MPTPWQLLATHGLLTFPARSRFWCYSDQRSGYGLTLSVIWPPIFIMVSGALIPECNGLSQFTLHYITSKTIYSGQSKKNCMVHYGASHTTMSGYDCRNKCVFGFRRKDNSDVAEVTSRGRVFQILGPAVANERSPIVTRRDGRTSRRLVDDNRRRVLAGMLAM